MRKISWIFLFLLVFSINAEDQDLPVFISTKELIKSKSKKIIWKKDHAKMVLIPAGLFEMGDHFSEGSEDELPVHRVELDSFYMNVHEVTIGQLWQFVEQSGYDYPDDY